MTDVKSFLDPRRLQRMTQNLKAQITLNCLTVFEFFQLEKCAKHPLPQPQHPYVGQAPWSRLTPFLEHRLDPVREFRRNFCAKKVRSNPDCHMPNHWQSQPKVTRLCVTTTQEANGARAGAQATWCDPDPSEKRTPGCCTPKRGAHRYREHHRTYT